MYLQQGEPIQSVRVGKRVYDVMPGVWLPESGADPKAGDRVLVISQSVAGGKHFRLTIAWAYASALAQAVMKCIRSVDGLGEASERPSSAGQTPKGGKER